MQRLHRTGILTIVILAVLLPNTRRLPADVVAAKKPNVILCMTDDQGWGDTGYNGHPLL